MDEKWVERAKAVAAEKGISMNAVLVDALRKGLEIEGQSRKNNLDRFAGDSPEEFGADWDTAMEAFDTIDGEIWK
ncbi:MAG: hypothetical protein H7Y36_10640 [Armatimonadetes bacterium]|nr:hypothetical protein [Akkermansiaceae bacterium]